MNKKLKKVLSKIRTKLWTSKKLTEAEEMFLRNIISEDIKTNIGFYKNSWNIIVSSLASSYTEESFKTYFLIQAQMKKDQSQFDFLIPLLQAEHMNFILSKENKEKIIIFKSKKNSLEVNLLKQELILNKNGQTYIKKYQLNDLPLFRKRKE